MAYITWAISYDSSYSPWRLSEKSIIITDPEWLPIPQFEVINNSVKTAKNKESPTTHKTYKRKRPQVFVYGNRSFELLKSTESTCNRNQYNLKYVFSYKKCKMANL